MIDLNTLNNEQREAVITTDGPLLILAGAGSGKTRVLTYRIAYLIQNGVYPGSILAITFTNKASQEMKERVAALVGDEANKMWISTFHSTCVRILRQDIEKIGFSKNFVIYDTQDQEKVIKDCLKELNIDDKLFPPKKVLNTIGSQKDKLVDADTYYRKNANDYQNRRIAELYALYQKKLKSNNALDFDDIIMNTIKLFRENQDVLNYYQRKFRYVLVDEYQDTNRAQYELVNMLAKAHGNLCVVGDDDQCIAEGANVLTREGNIPIENIADNQSLICAAGRGEITLGLADKIRKNKYQGIILKVNTCSGKVIKATPNHIGFVKINSSPGIYYVYLMYKKSMGYRIGQTQGVRSRKGEITNGLFVRLNQEHADKMWILRICKDKAEASFYEQFFSVKYGVPTTVFETANRKMSMTQEYVDKMFVDINTYEAASKLMEDLIIYEEYPHHISNAVVRGQSIRRIINLTSFGGTKYKTSNLCGHRIALITSGDELKNKALDSGFPTRKGKRTIWRIETERKEYDDALLYAKKLTQMDGSLEIVKKAKLSEDKSFSYMPFAHIRPTMSIAIYENGKIIEDIVESVEIEEYDGYVYDISVPHLRQFICDGVVVHNSIYGWRGADISNILDFEDDYPNVKTIKLEQNYRSTKKILEAANYVITNNEKRKEKKLWTENVTGDNIKLFRADTDRDESLFIINEIEKLVSEGFSYRDFAILYRTNAMSRILEEGFVRSRVPYKVVGGLKFYDRREVKDVLAYLKVINNPVDSVSLERIINVPKRGIGDATIDKVKLFGQDRDMGLYSSMLEIDNVEGLTKRAVNSIDKFISLMNHFISIKDGLKVSDMINEILEKTEYTKELKEENTPENQSRIENLNELYSAAVEFEENAEDKSLSAFLERVALVSDQDSISETGGIVLMTLHTAKGLEFPVVFIAGMEEGIFPHSSSQEDEDELEEERRLCYVGITRAKQQLYITCAKQRLMFGRTMFNAVSSFVEEIPETLIEDISIKTQSSYGRVYDYDNNSNAGQQRRTQPWQTPTLVAKPVNNLSSGEIKAGVKIKHKVFGKGIVIAVKNSGEDKQITVHFDSSGLKNLLLSASPIEIL
ncbi:MAG: family ATPase [Clostridiales bacterium]|jgi:DNA helicase-2/ATP-dependent DNA helicase PcrA|nr:family ATPase [Clostridiales bacterium]